MAFRSTPRYQERIVYAPNATKTFVFPRGNLYAGMTLDINAEVDISVAAATNAPDYQIARIIKEVEIIQDANTSVWKISGEALAAYFEKRRGIASPGNTTIAGATGNNKQGRMTLYCPFAPEDALKPWDFLMDTRAHKYEMRIVFRDVTQAGTFFATLGGGSTIAAVNEENYIELALDQVDLKVGPNGAEDALVGTAPLMRGLFERTIDITASNANGLKIDLPVYKTFRNILLWATHETNANQIQGNGGVLTDRVTLLNTQNKTFQVHKASMLREATAVRWEDTALNAGLYEIAVTRWGAVTDTEVSDNSNELYLLAPVTKLANGTALRVISDTVERQ